MELRIVVLVGVAASVGWVARGVSSGSPVAPVAAAAPAPVQPRVVYVAAPEREQLPPPEDDDTGEGEDLGEVFARARAAAPPPPPPEPPHNLVDGIVVADHGGGERLAGVTVVATGPGIEGSRTAITDENGEYSIADLPAGYYTMTFYYIDHTIEHRDVPVSSFKHTDVNVEMTGSTITNIPVPGRTFESALGDAAGSQGDSYGVSFSGTTSLENTYYVDGIDVTSVQ